MYYNATNNTDNTLMSKIKNNKPQDELLTHLLNNFNQSCQNSSLKIYQHIKAAIKELSCGCQKDDRLSSIRAISDAFGVAPVPVQRAITELIGEDVLYVKNGVGIFVKNPPQKFSAKFTGHHTLRKINDLVFLFYDASDLNRAMMLRIVEKFRNEHRGGPSIKLIFERNDDEQNPDMAVQFDISSKFLDLSDFGKHEINKGNLKVLGRYGGILAYISYYLFYNIDLLAKLGLDKPSYKNFKEQEEYICTAKQSLGQMNMLGPTSWNRPQFFLGKETADVLSFLKGSDELDSPQGQRIFNLLTRIMEYYNLFSYEGSDPALNDVSGIGCFINAQTPLFTGYTGCYPMLLEQKRLGFKWDIYPIFACDDTLPLEPLYATVDAGTRLPMECIKFLSYLQLPDTQKEFFEQGFITVQRNGRCLVSNANHIKVAQESFSGYLEESTDNYIFEHILDSELMECGLHKKDIRESFENIYNYSRGYLRHFGS